MNPVLYWNDVAMEVHRRDYAGDRWPEHAGCTRASRALAIVHLAVLDTLARAQALATSAGAQARGYLHAAPMPTKAETLSPEAALGAAASRALVRLWSRQREFIGQHEAEFLATLAPSSPIAASQSFGRAVADRHVEDRQNDGSDAQAVFVPRGTHGTHRADPYDPNGACTDPHWGSVRSFLVDRKDDGARAPSKGPFDHTKLLSPWNKERHAKDLKEVMEIGALRSVTRSPEQTLVGIFWAYDEALEIGSCPRLYNQCIRAVRDQVFASNPAGDMRSDAMLLALVHAGMADAAIVAWAAKFDYQVWRPIVAIRNVEQGWDSTLGSTNTDRFVGDPFWRPLGAPSTNRPGAIDRTPQHPAYPSAHAALGTVALEITRRFYGGRDTEFNLTSDEFDGRSLDSDGSARICHSRRLTITRAVEENLSARVYLGVSCRSDGEGGRDIGERIARVIGDAWPKHADFGDIDRRSDQGTERKRAFIEVPRRIGQPATSM